VVSHVLQAEEVTTGAFSVTLLDDAAIAALNRDHLGHDGPTDVISFPLHEAGEAPVGDVYVGAERCIAQAAEEGVDPREETIRVIVHGILHTLGYDHPAGEARLDSEMWARQEDLVQKILEERP